MAGRAAKDFYTGTFTRQAVINRPSPDRGNERDGANGRTFGGLAFSHTHLTKVTAPGFFSERRRKGIEKDWSVDLLSVGNHRRVSIGQLVERGGFDGFEKPSITESKIEHRSSYILHDYRACVARGSIRVGSTAEIPVKSVGSGSTTAAVKRLHH